LRALAPLGGLRVFPRGSVFAIEELVGLGIVGNDFFLAIPERFGCTLRLLLWRYPFQERKEFREIMLNSLPDDFEIQLIVPVDDSIPQTRDPLPRISE